MLKIKNTSNTLNEEVYEVSLVPSSEDMYISIRINNKEIGFIVEYNDYISFQHNGPIQSSDTFMLPKEELKK